ncbi:putative inorganic phosphate cotransporter isoform X2 [Macrosteles quadrilineatus]|uniref:putative inorganic phosphate cotransporter isoform X2 n=1 Tax=Macrosteles quadrilineatus TaxID=74068 RepID=UPI0023E117EB|nr:putative inorganic phosphate cotransporter isoform X2 [Macrosteles quadrilineatus]
MWFCFMEFTPLLPKKFSKTGDGRKYKTCIPQRYVLGIMGLLGMANAYIMRACLSIAITAMVTHRPPDSTYVNEEECPAVDQGNSTVRGVMVEGTYDWDEKTQGLILSSFYYGYIITHVPGGVLAQRFGGKHTLGLGIFSTAIFTLLTPITAESMGAWGLILLRFLMGLGEGTTFPALSTLLAQWAPPLEKSKLSSLCFAGVQLGMIIATSLGGIIIQYTASWASVFYVFGLVGVVWFVIWCLVCYNDPASHPFITEEERAYLEETIGCTKRDKDLGGTPWKTLLTSAPVWALIIGECGHDWGLYTMITDLPKYMNDVMHFNIAQNGLVSAIPYLTMWICSIAIGALADWLLAREIITITPMRKVLATVGAVGPGLGVVLASYAGCDKFLVTVLFTIGMGLMGFCYASLRVNSLDLSPNYAGSIMALVNGLSSVSGMATPYLIGVLTPNRSLREWRVVFWIMFAVLFFSNCVFVWWGSGEVQPWNDPKKEKQRLQNGKQSPTKEKFDLGKDTRDGKKALPDV